MQIIGGNMMRKGDRKMELGQVRETVRAMSANHHDHLIPVCDLQFESVDQVRIGDTTHVLQPQAQKQIAARFNIPQAYLYDCDADLAAYNLNRRKTQERNDKLFIRFNGTEVRAIFTPRYKPADNSMVIDRLLSIYPESTKAMVHLDGGIMYLGLLTGKEMSARKDALRGGISVINSEIGLARIMFMFFILRLICTNGATVSEDIGGLSRRHISEGTLDDVERFIAKAGLGGDILLSYMERLMEIPVEDMDATYERLNKRFAFSERETDAIGWAKPFVEMEPGFDRNMYTVMNTYTKAAQAPFIDAKVSFHLEKAGGEILLLEGPKQKLAA